MYTYAFLQAPSFTLRLPTGIAGRLELVRIDRLAALTEPDVDLTELQQDDRKLVEAALAHDRVMCDVFEQAPLLPLQFGTVFASRDRLIEHLHRRQDLYLEKLERLANCVEYCCKLTPRNGDRYGELDTSLETSDSFDTPEAPEGGTFAASDRTILSSQPLDFNPPENDSLEVEKQNILDRRASRYPRLVAQRQGQIQRAYVLVPRGQANELEEQVMRWRSQLNNWQLELGDPLPPYHFV